jgi:hypothetical protein
VKIEKGFGKAKANDTKGYNRMLISNLNFHRRAAENAEKKIISSSPRLVQGTIFNLPVWKADLDPTVCSPALLQAGFRLQIHCKPSFFYRKGK